MVEKQPTTEQRKYNQVNETGRKKKNPRKNGIGKNRMGKKR